MKAPTGLTNLGNTCYMSATVQCLRSIPELCDTLSEHVAIGGAADIDHSTSITNGMYVDMYNITYMFHILSSIYI